MHMKGYETHPEEVCGNCQHFRLHYICMSENNYVPISYGHCVFPMLKRRRTEETCPNWSPIKSDEAES